MSDTIAPMMTDVQDVMLDDDGDLAAAGEAGVQPAHVRETGGGSLAACLLRSMKGRPPRFDRLAYCSLQVRAGVQALCNCRPILVRETQCILGMITKIGAPDTKRSFKAHKAHQAEPFVPTRFVELQTKINIFAV